MDDHLIADIADEADVGASELQACAVELAGEVVKLSHCILELVRLLRPFAVSYSTALAECPSLADAPDDSLWVQSAPLGDYRAAHRAVFGGETA